MLVPVVPVPVVPVPVPVVPVPVVPVPVVPVPVEPVLPPDVELPAGQNELLLEGTMKSNVNGLPLPLTEVARLTVTELVVNGVELEAAGVTFTTMFVEPVVQPVPRNEVAIANT